MRCFYVTLFLVGIPFVLGESRFPQYFKFGISTSAYQIEGAWNVSDKTESIWDRMLHTRQFKTGDNTNGDVAADSYHHFKRDVQLIKNLGVDFYRFSISWPRLLPTGFPDVISEDGKRYYNDLIDELLTQNITPMVTIYHWDIPQNLQEYGGWMNPLVAEWVEDFADVLFRLFADRVKDWVTINEPEILCDFGHGGVSMVPALNQSGIADYICSKNVLMAHARIWRLFDEKYRPKHGGHCGITNHVFWTEPATDSLEDSKAADDANELFIDRFAHPVFSAEGGWPPHLERKVATRSALQGYARSRLPPFTSKEQEFVRGTADFYGLNHYTTWEARRLVKETPRVDSSDDLDIELTVRDIEDPKIFWFRYYPPGLRKNLRYIKEKYNNPRVIITENGYPTTNTGLDDNRRIKYHQEYLQQVLDAIYEDGCNVTHYSVWTLMDSFEWIGGYMSKPGLYQVDYPELVIRPKKSAFFYKQLTKTRTLDHDFEPVLQASLNEDDLMRFLTIDGVAYKSTLSFMAFLSIVFLFIFCAPCL